MDTSGAERWIGSLVEPKYINVSEPKRFHFTVVYFLIIIGQHVGYLRHFALDQNLFVGLCSSYQTNRCKVQRAFSVELHAYLVVQSLVTFNITFSLIL